MKLKKIGAALVAALALAAISAGPASAAEGILVSGGTGVPVGTGIAGSAAGAVHLSSGGNTVFECSGAELSGTVVGNTTESVNINLESGRLTGPETGGKCKTPLGNAAVTFEAPMCLSHNRGATRWSLRGNVCTAEARRLAFTIETTNVGICTYTRAATAELTSPINTSPLLISTKSAEFAKASGSALCWGSLKLEGTFELKTSSGASLKVTG